MSPRHQPWRRMLGAAGLAAGIALALTGFGWRYGFAPLPTPVPIPPTVTLAAAQPEARDPGTVHAFRTGVAQAVAQAEEAARHDDTAAALGHLIEALRWHAAVVPASEFAGWFDERGADEVNEVVTRPFRRLALTGGALSARDRSSLIEALTTIATGSGRPGQAYLRAVQRDACRLEEARRPDWARVGRSVRMAGMLIRQDSGRLLVELLERTLGRRQGGEPNYHGAAHSVRPVVEWVAAMQTLVARGPDFAAMQAACVSRTIAALEAGRLPSREETPSWLPDPVTHRRAWRQWLDRPAVWRLTEVLPDARLLLEEWQQWRVYVESCRLSLALRGFYDQYHRWPDRLDELVPEFLPSVPRDPFADAPFGYERTAGGWRFWSRGPGQGEPAPVAGHTLTQRMFHSTEGTAPGRQE